MKNPVTLFGALGVGAGLMYFLDPDRGKRRRALARDKAVHLSNVTQREISKKTADLRNRAQGLWSETEGLFQSEPPTDAQLEGQVRARLGRLTSHPHAVKTAVKDGKVTLSGPILADEAEILWNGVFSIRGVKEIENYLEIHESSEHMSSLQGGRKSRELVLEKKTEWSNKTRLLAAAAGAGLVLQGVRKRTVVNSLLASFGVGLMARSAANKPLESLIAQSVEKPVKIQKSITINAPKDKVFNVLKYPKYLPNFMSHVRKVERIGEKQFLWTVDGVAGGPVEWITEVTEVIPDKLIRWKSAGDPSNDQSGYLRLEPTADGATRLNIEMNYQPPGGTFGHFVAGLFSRDPKSEMDDDLLRLKTFIETGRLPHDAAANHQKRSEMKVKEIMTRNPVFAILGTSLHDVAQMMSECDCGCIPVVENRNEKKPVGVITDRDITVRTIAHNKNPLNMVAGEVMTDTLVTITPEMSVEDCIAKMEGNQIRRIVVVDDAGNLAGVVAQADIARQAPAFETAELVKDLSLTANA